MTIFPRTLLIVCCWTLIGVVLFVDVCDATTQAAAEHHNQANGNIIGQLKDTLFQEAANNVFDWVFGDPNDAERQEHELAEHFSYLAGDAPPRTSPNGDPSLSAGPSFTDMAAAAGIKFDFLNFKAHDYDNNDRIDGLELLAMILHEKQEYHDNGQRFAQPQQQAQLQYQQQQQQQPPQHQPPQHHQQQPQYQQQQQQQPPQHYQQQQQPPPHHPHHQQQQQQPIPLSNERMQFITGVVDRLLDEEDTNRNGFLEFDEYSRARHRVSANVR